MGKQPIITQTSNPNAYPIANTIPNPASTAYPTSNAIRNLIPNPISNLINCIPTSNAIPNLIPNPTSNAIQHQILHQIQLHNLIPNAI